MTREEKFNGLLTELKLYFYTDRFEFILNELEEEINSVCEWKYDEDLCFYETSCGNGQYFTDGKVEQNKYKYCPFCGRKIKVVE